MKLFARVIAVVITAATSILIVQCIVKKLYNRYHISNL